MDKLLGGVVTGIGRIRIGLGGVGSVELALDGGEIHGTLDDTRIVGNAESDGIDGLDER